MECKQCHRSTSEHKCTGKWKCNECSSGRQHYVHLCRCKRCNFCHEGGVNHTAKKLGPHWFTKSGSREKILPFRLGQSHGGHGYIPMIDKPN